MLAEAARTLGEIGDRRASDPLLDILTRTQDPRIAGESSKALARLGEIAAIYEIVPRMISTPTPVLRKSLAIAAADLLGKPGEFYGILLAEERNRGVSVEKMIRTIHNIIETSSSLNPSAKKALHTRSDDILNLYDTAVATTGNILASIFDLATGLVEYKQGIRWNNEPHSFIQASIWQDRHIGMGIWTIHMMSEKHTDATDHDNIGILLAIYIITQWRG